jgi:hypothetical protein
MTGVGRLIERNLHFLAHKLDVLAMKLKNLIVDRIFGLIEMKMSMVIESG